MSTKHTGEEGGKLQSYRSVSLPHLRADVHFMDLSKLKGVPIKGSAYTCIFGENPDNLHLDIAVFFVEIEEVVRHRENCPTIAHELMHVIQILCEQRNMTIEQEQEHTAYIMSYLMEELLK